MSLTIFEKVKEFLVRIVKDETFRNQLMSEKVEEVKKALENGGYNFSQAEFETAAIKILELKEKGEFHDLSEEELIGAFGGFTRNNELIVQPVYGVISLPPDQPPKPSPKPWTKPRPINLKPICGIVISPIDQPVQPMYGVVIPEELQ